MSRTNVISFAVLFLYALPLWALDPEGTPIYPLWPDRETTSSSNETAPTKHGTRFVKVAHPEIALYKSATAADSAPAVVVFPGGGYKLLAYMKEGVEVAQWLNSLGIHAAVVKYTVPCPEERMLALRDAQRAISMVRQNAAQWGIDPAKVGVLGFSAGGHLSASASTKYKQRSYSPVDQADQQSCRPDFTVLVYPAYLYTDDNPDKLPDDIVIDEDTPPTFIVQSVDDYKYIKSAFNYARALNDAKVPVELHLFPKGGHGYGLRVKDADHTARQWPGLCAAWLEQTLETSNKTE